MSTNGTTKTAHELSIELAPGAEGNGFATMLADLVRQNLESKPHKRKDFDALDGTVALIADDADVALTLEFRPGRSRGEGGSLTLHDGIKGIPDVAVRGSADSIMAMSNVPLTRPLGLPVPTDRPGLEVVRGMLRASWTGELKIHGMLGNMGLLSRLTRVMSVNG
ncbi:MAG TPA: hypothetical protein VM925_16780 [Labilithrix sp.]|nr:hypothetical protein [Labilithrix sp.]